MRRMLLPEVNIKSKLKDDIYKVTFEELLTYAHVINPADPNTKSLIIQPISQRAGNKDDFDGGIFITEPSTSTDITNSTLTITVDLDYIYINGLGTNVVMDLSVTNLEEVSINSPYHFDVYIIKP